MNLENTLWMGGIPPGITESQISNSFKYFNITPINVKFIRDKLKNKNKSYCFITFKSFEEANNALTYLNGQKIPNSDIIFRLNWADYQGANKTVYVGGLNPNITKDDLFLFFKQKYKSVHNARIIYGENEISKGYGFVNFKCEEEYYMCLKEMDGINFCGNNIKVREQIKKEDENKKRKANEKNVHNNIFIKNNLININNISNQNDIMIQNNIINNTNNINNSVINCNQNNINLNNNLLRNINNNKIMEFNPINNLQNSFGNNNIINISNNINNLLGINKINNLSNKEEKNINNFNSIQSIDNLINKKNSSSFFLNINNNQQNLNKSKPQNISLINEPKLNLNIDKKLITPKENIISKTNENQDINNIIKEKIKKKERKKYRLEVLEIIDEVTLYRKIHESILRTFSNYQILLLKNGTKFRSKYYYFN